MKTTSTAIVVGAGLGGIATAARLARAGYAVTVYEKNRAPGGRCSQLLLAGHRFDVGPTLFMMPDVFAETYAALGERMSDHLDLRRVDPTYAIHFHDRSCLSPSADPETMRRQMESFEPGSYAALQRYLAEGRHHYEHALAHVIGRNFPTLASYIAPRNLWEVIVHLHALRNHYRRLGRYFHDPRLKAAFTFQDMYLGLSPFDAPATYSLLSYLELMAGVWFPLGGMYSVVTTLERIACHLGVQFVYDAPVTRVAVGERRATGVVLADGSYQGADIVVINADLPYAYEHLLPAGPAAKRIGRMHYTCSTIVFYWGLDRVYPRLGPHTLFVSKEYGKTFRQIFADHTLPDDPSIYVHAPARLDPAAAPAGGDTLLALVPVGHLDEKQPQDWPAIVARARAAVLARLAGIGAPDIDAHCTVEQICAPAGWRDAYNLAKGAAFGLSHTMRQVGYLRPHNRHRRYGNLYFVGSSTHPGCGLPMVLLSAKLVTERIVSDAVKG